MPERNTRPFYLAILPLALLSATAAQAQTADPQLPQITIIATSPLLGSGVDRDTVPAETNVLKRDDMTRGGITQPDAVRALNEQVGGVNLDSPPATPYQPTLVYHGFQASALQGTPQGLAVYVNGVRFNQAFGDTVNFDLLPNMAIGEMNLVGSNPVFGLNALGGAVNVQLKNGFTYQGGELVLHGGSFGSYGADFQYGKQSGNTSVYVAASGIHQDGWRDLQSSDLENFFGDVGWRGNTGELQLQRPAGQFRGLNGPGSSPVGTAGRRLRRPVHRPQRNLQHFYAGQPVRQRRHLSDTLSLQAATYYNNFLQRATNGNAANDTPCNDGSGLLCNDSGPSTTTGGATIPAFLGANPFSYSELDNQTTNTNGYGASGPDDRHPDRVRLQQPSGRRPQLRRFPDRVHRRLLYRRHHRRHPRLHRPGPGVVLDEPGTNVPVRVGISNATYGAFIADTFNLTDRLAFTASGRFNAEQINLNDQNGGDLTGNHAYQRFNPAAGATYKLTPWLTAYAGYAEANRAPTPAELSCAGPNDSCSLANFFMPAIQT